MVLNREKAWQRIQDTLFRCGARGIERTTTGAQFICPVPKHGELAFLHSLYGPCDSSKLAGVQELFGYKLPSEYISFMELHNGASLFVDAISIYGWGVVLSRSSALTDRAAIFLDSAHQEYKFLERGEWLQSWRPIGGLVAKKPHDLTVNSSGVFRLRTASGRERAWTSFTQMLADCMGAADACFDCDGIGDAGYALLEEAFESLAAPIN